MLATQKYQNKNIAIYGMGKTGISVARKFKKLKAQVFCWDDSKEIRKKVKKSNLLINKFWLNKNIIDFVAISPGVDINKCKLKKYLKNNFNKLITDLDLFFELNRDKVVISVTGTNGKSTTCKIIEKILKTAKYKVQTVGNIGNPILSSSNSKKKYILILEASSYQLQYSKIFRSRHAVLLNISPDHLDRHGNIKNYIKAKSKIFFAQNKSDFSYINATNKYSKYIKKIFKNKKLKSKLILINKKNYNFLIKKIKNKYFKSNGNFENMVFAYKIAKNLKVNNNTIIKALNRFRGLDHRQEVVLSRKNLLCINDSKATSFDASLQSLLNYERIYWIVGGIPKYKDQFFLHKVKKNIIKAYIVGSNISFFKKQINNNFPYQISKNIKHAVYNIKKDLQLNKNLKSTVLLSPAAASFDQFSSFENRGNYFKNLILSQFKNGFNA